jgi:hypothetical protein
MGCFCSKAVDRELLDMRWMGWVGTKVDEVVGHVYSASNVGAFMLLCDMGVSVGGWCGQGAWLAGGRYGWGELYGHPVVKNVGVGYRVENEGGLEYCVFDGV